MRIPPVSEVLTLRHQSNLRFRSVSDSPGMPHGFNGRLLLYPLPTILGGVPGHLLQIIKATSLGFATLTIQRSRRAASATD